MSAATLFVIRNHAGQFLNKQHEWLDASQAAIQAVTLYRTLHRDEAVNTVFEISAKDIYLRAEVFACKPDPKGAPILEPDAFAASETIDDATELATERPETA